MDNILETWSCPDKKNVGRPSRSTAARKQETERPDTDGNGFIINWHGQEYETSVHENANGQDASGSSDEKKKMPEGLGDGGRRNEIK